MLYIIIQKSPWKSYTTSLYPAFPVMNPLRSGSLSCFRTGEHISSHQTAQWPQAGEHPWAHVRIHARFVRTIRCHAPQALRWWHIISHNAFSNPHLREERAGGDGCSTEWDLTGGGRNDLVCRGSLTLRGKVFALGVGVKRAASPNIQTGATWMWI